MKTLQEHLTENIMNEGIVPVNDINMDRPVMFSTYGDPEGPWYFGYLATSHSNGEQGVANPPIKGRDAMLTYPKLIVDFDKFDPKNLKNNAKNNIK